MVKPSNRDICRRPEGSPGRRADKPALDNEGIHTGLPQLEGDQACGLYPPEGPPDLPDAALVAYCQGYPGCQGQSTSYVLEKGLQIR